MTDSWIDAIADVWSDVDAGNGKKVESYHIDKLPDAISVFPSAITYPNSIDVGDYGVATTNIDIHHGMTEFHLFPTVDLKNLYPAYLFMRRIEKAAKIHVGLGGLVHWFMLEPQDSISLVEFEYDNSPSHRGLLVRWAVKEDTSKIVPVTA